MKEISHISNNSFRNVVTSTCQFDLLFGLGAYSSLHSIFYRIIVFDKLYYSDIQFWHCKNAITNLVKAVNKFNFERTLVSTNVNEQVAIANRTVLKRMLRSIFCIALNKHSDRKWKIMQNLFKRTIFSKCFSFYRSLL